MSFLQGMVKRKFTHVSNPLKTKRSYYTETNYTISTVNHLPGSYIMGMLTLNLLKMANFKFYWCTQPTLESKVRL